MQGFFGSANKCRADVCPRSTDDNGESRSSPRFIGILFKPVNGFAVIFFAGFRNGLRPLGVVQAVGIELGLQGRAGAFAVVYTVLALFIQEIAGVELDAGAVGVNGHAPSGNRVGKGGAGIAEDFPVVVIAALQLQRLVVRADVLTDGLGGAEIHGRPRNAAQFTGGDIFGIIGVEETAGDGQKLIHGGIRLFVAGQIEIAVVGEIEDGILVAGGIVHDVQAILLVQRIGHPDNGIARETLVAVGAVQFQSDGGPGVRYRRPHPLEEEVRAGVQVVSALVGSQAVRFTAQFKGGALQTVGVAANGSAQCRAVGGAVAVAVIIAQDHVRKLTVPVGDQQADKGCTVIGDRCGEAATGYCVQGSGFSGGQNAESFFHENGSFHFSWGKKRNYVKNAYWDYTIFPAAFQTFL